MPLNFEERRERNENHPFLKVKKTTVSTQENRSLPEIDFKERRKLEENPELKDCGAEHVNDRQEVGAKNSMSKS